MQKVELILDAFSLKSRNPAPPPPPLVPQKTRNKTHIYSERAFQNPQSPTPSAPAQPVSRNLQKAKLILDALSLKSRDLAPPPTFFRPETPQKNAHLL